MTSSTDGFEIEVAPDGSTLRLGVSGELDLLTGPVLAGVASAVGALRVPVVELDLRGVRFVDVAGWRAVGRAVDLLHEAGSLAFVGRWSPPVARLARLVGEPTLVAPEPVGAG